MSCDWEGNRRSGVALAMHHRHKWFSHLQAQGLSKGDEHPTNTPYGVWYSTFYYGGGHHIGNQTSSVKTMNHDDKMKLTFHKNDNDAVT